MVLNHTIKTNSVVIMMILIISGQAIADLPCFQHCTETCHLATPQACIVYCSKKCLPPAFAPNVENKFSNCELGCSLAQCAKYSYGTIFLCPYIYIFSFSNNLSLSLSCLTVCVLTWQIRENWIVA